MTPAVALRKTADQEAVEAVIEELRPFIKSDGGDVEFLGIDENQRVRVRMTGACATCPSSVVTLKSGIERRIQEKAPSILEVIAIQ